MIHVCFKRINLLLLLLLLLESSHDKVGTKSLEIEKDSVNDESEPNTHREELPPNPSEKQPSTSDDNSKGKGGCSTADMVPLELKKNCLLTLRGTLISLRDIRKVR